MSPYYNKNRRTYRPGASAHHQSFNSQRSSRPKRGMGQYIDPAKFVKSARMVEAEDYVPSHSFKDFDVDPLIKRNLAAKGYTLPTPIQDQTIPLALEGRDIIGVAHTGTGKTAAFSIPALNRLITDPHSRILIVAPTRELAQQIQVECRAIAKDSGLYGALLIGGLSMVPQLRDLRSNPRIVIGTPGRIKDHIERKTLNLLRFNIVVLDEVDRMLDMGFVNDVRHILGQLAPKRQSFFFSATLDTRVNNLIQSFANDPVTVSLKTSETSDNINQDVIKYTGSGDKLDKLHDVLIKSDVEKILVFDETQRNVKRLSEELVSRGFKAESIHGGKSQGQRQRALNKFRNNEINILVATNVAARGIDVVDITHVINYSIPQSYDDYIHRIGRAGRAGRIGHALTFIQA